MRISFIISCIFALVVASAVHAQAISVSPEDARSIAKEAVIYGFPLLDSYRIQYSYFVDNGGPEFKGAWNAVHDTARVYTPEDKAIQTLNSDTSYSFVGADLRAEPLVFTVPAVDKDRYYSLQFIDMYTPSKAEWPTHGKPSPNTRRPSSIRESEPAPTASARASF
jgi:hypothetical protein